jgi:transcription factor WhiB
VSATTKMSRRAWDLRSDPADSDLDAAACARREVDPDMWHAGDIASELNEAAHICQEHCPVRHACLEKADRRGPDNRRSQVLGGVLFDQKGQERLLLPTSTCRLCVAPADRAVWLNAVELRQAARRASSHAHQPQVA